MFRLILFHPGIDLKQKLYLFYAYCFCYYIDSILYFFITFKRNQHLKKTWGGKGGRCFLRDFNLVHKDLKKYYIDTEINGDIDDGKSWEHAYSFLKKKKNHHG